MTCDMQRKHPMFGVYSSSSFLSASSLPLSHLSLHLPPGAPDDSIWFPIVESGIPYTETVWTDGVRLV